MRKRRGTGYIWVREKGAQEFRGQIGDQENLLSEIGARTHAAFVVLVLLSGGFLPGIINPWFLLLRVTKEN